MLRTSDESEATLGAHLKKARLNAGMTQAALARQSQVNRLKIVRAEVGTYSLTIDEVQRITAVLKAPIQQFLTGQTRPSTSLQGFAVELYHLGIRDYVVKGAEVPGAFRRSEEVLTLVLKGNCPEARLVDAMPFVLATQVFNVKLALAFADLYDRRVRVRLAWLCDVTLTLGRLSTFPVPIRSPEALEKLVGRVKKPAKPDDLGHPSSQRLTPLWRRWNIAYGGTMEDFLARARDLAAHQTMGAEV